MAQTTPDASFGPFSLFVGFLFPLRRPSLAAVGLCGPSWLSSAPKRGCGGCGAAGCVVQKKKDRAAGVCDRAGSTGRGYCQAYPHPYPPVPVPVTLGVWPDPCLSLWASKVDIISAEEDIV